MAVESALGTRAPVEFSSEPPAGRSVKTSDAFRGLVEGSVVLSEDRVLGLLFGEEDDPATLWAIWYRGTAEGFKAPTLDFRGGATSGNSFNVGWDGVTLRTED